MELPPPLAWRAPYPCDGPLAVLAASVWDLLGAALWPGPGALGGWDVDRLQATAADCLEAEVVSGASRVRLVFCQGRTTPPAVDRAHLDALQAAGLHLWLGLDPAAIAAPHTLLALCDLLHAVLHAARARARRPTLAAAAYALARLFAVFRREDFLAILAQRLGVRYTGLTVTGAGMATLGFADDGGDFGVRFRRLPGARRLGVELVPRAGRDRSGFAATLGRLLDER